MIVNFYCIGRNRGMTTIGRNKAVAHIHFAKFGGYLAWLGWLFSRRDRYIRAALLVRPKNQKGVQQNGVSRNCKKQVL
jgi:NADH dehydrogenase FAD-containing subunit